MAKIITVGFDSSQPLHLVDMSYIRWFSISRELSELGHEVDIATNHRGATGRCGKISLGARLRQVPLDSVNWGDYDVVKTVYQRGFETLETYGGASHPFIIARMSGIVDRVDRDGIYFKGERRRWLCAMQEKIHKRSCIVSLTTEPAKKLWQDLFGYENSVLLVPGAAATEIPTKRHDPYPPSSGYRCLFAGNLFDRVSQEEVNEHLTLSLNSLGEMLSRKNIRLFAIGSGDATRLDRRWVTHLGPVPYADSWDYFYFASVGIALQWGLHPNQNELTKIYYYLRVGLPVVCQSGFPNSGLIEDTRMGYVVPNGDLIAMADRIEEATRRTDWNRKEACRWISTYHTWKNRAETYHRFMLERNLPTRRKRRRC